MASYKYYTPTKVVFGKDAVEETGRLLKEFGARKVLVHFGSHHAKKSGLLDRIESLIRKEGIDFVELGGVVPNPRLSKVREGVQLCRKEHVDFLLAVGGGSVIDSSKAIGYALHAGIDDPWCFYEKSRTPEGCFPVACVLTIAAAGSEMSDSSVITNEDGWLKRGLNSDYCRCAFAIEDPTLTMSLPHYQTMSGCADIMMHTMERFFSGSKTMTLTDGIALALLKDVRQDALILEKNPEDYDARANVMFASSISHNGLTNMGGEVGDWSCHQMEHELGGMFDCAHGAGLASLWPSWARYVMDADYSRFALFGEKVFDMERSGDDKADAEKAVQAVEAFYRTIGMPTTMTQLGLKVSDDQIEELATKCTFFGKRTIGSFKTLAHKDLVAIYTAAR